MRGREAMGEWVQGAKKGGARADRQNLRDASNGIGIGAARRVGLLRRAAFAEAATAPRAPRATTSTQSSWRGNCKKLSRSRRGGCEDVGMKLMCGEGV